jgi:2-phosphosulfolactate phosphatase
MPAPDLPPPPPAPQGPLPLFVHLHVRLLDPAVVAGATVIVIDQIRASVTMTAALHARAPFIEPVLTVEDAFTRAAALRTAGIPALIGGERAGIAVEGFDLDNSPRNYTQDRIAGRPLVFTTSNGTASLLHVRRAHRILVGSLSNLSAIVSAVATDPRPVHILCAGTRDEISLDDCLPAGAMVQRLIAQGRTLGSDDSGRMCLALWRDTLASKGGIATTLRESRGGRNLSRIGLDADIDFCAKVDHLPVLPAFDPGTGRITIERSSHAQIPQTSSRGHQSQPGMPALGIDGCAGGWIVASLGSQWHASTPRVEFEIHPTLDFLESLTPSRVCIDIPIGLSRAPRTCDMLARRALLGAASRVFTPPCREVLACVDWIDANAMSRKLTGKGLSKQAFNITQKIREADELLARVPHLRGVLREVHPEVCFARLAGRVLPSKKTFQGIAARIEILSQRIGIEEDSLRAQAARLRPAGAKLDDLLDAAIALVVALTPAGVTSLLPPTPEHDERGLAMEMICADL